MGIKLNIVNYKVGRRICVTYDILQYKKRTTTFKLEQRVEALDFANALPDRYITGIDEELRGFAVDICHPILKKSLCFA